MEIKIKKKIFKFINSISLFPSGNILTVSNDKSINIYEETFEKIIQIILAAHNSIISYISVKDENNFVSSSIDGSIKTWIKKKINEKEQFYLNHIINNAHSLWIIKVIYNLKGNLISCSGDGIIKIWEENNNNTFQIISLLKNDKSIYSILLIEKKNILISSGENGTKFYNLNNYELICNIINAKCYSNNALIQLNEDNIIVGGGYDYYIKIISIKEKKIIKDVYTGLTCFGIFILEEKNIIIVGGYNSQIILFNKDNFNCLKKKNVYHCVNGFIQLKNGSIVAFGGHQTDIFEF